MAPPKTEKGAPQSGATMTAVASSLVEPAHTAAEPLAGPAPIEPIPPAEARAVPRAVRSGTGGRPLLVPRPSFVQSKPVADPMPAKPASEPPAPDSDDNAVTLYPPAAPGAGADVLAVRPASLDEPDAETRRWRSSRSIPVAPRLPKLDIVDDQTNGVLSAGREPASPADSVNAGREPASPADDSMNAVSWGSLRTIEVPSAARDSTRAIPLVTRPAVPRGGSLAWPVVAGCVLFALLVVCLVLVFPTGTSSPAATGSTLAAAPPAAEPAPAAPPAPPAPGSHPDPERTVPALTEPAAVVQTPERVMPRSGPLSAAPPAEAKQAQAKPADTAPSPAKSASKKLAPSDPPSAGAFLRHLSQPAAGASPEKNR
jgi:hypothetical protein